MAAAAAVSVDQGLDHLCTYNCALNGEMFARFIKDLHAVRGRKKFALFLDNASFHKTNLVRDAAEELGIRLIWNVPYSPEYNPIESCFSVVKNHFKRARLNAMVNEKTFSFQKGIHSGFS